MRNFEQRLTGGHPNSLGNTIEVVDEVLADNALFDELFNCYFSSDEIVRLRVSNAVKRICTVNSKILVPYIDTLLGDVSKIDQASTKWTMAQLFGMLDKHMQSEQLIQAKSIIKNNLENESDWIVIKNSMETLGKWAKNDIELKDWLIPHLKKHQSDGRKTVSKKAEKILNLLSK